MPSVAEQTPADGVRIELDELIALRQEARRLDSSKMRRELGVVLRYPDLASGLPSCFE